MPPKKKAPAIEMSAFNVTKKANEGVKIDLTLPDGTPTEHFIVVRGADSTRFRGARAKYNREMVKSMKGCKDDPEKKEHLQEETTRKMIATLVVDWSFPEECNETNIRKFLADAPQIQEQIDAFAGVRSNFFEKPPQD